MPKVSVIVPIYNASVFLSTSIESIQKQTHSDLEIILVNDCSTDNSLKICSDFALSDPRIKIIDKKVNEGVDYARFSGMEIMTGEYVTFMDADDILLEDAVETLLSVSIKNDVDIVYGNNIRVFSSKFGFKRRNQFVSEYTGRRISGDEKKDLTISFFGVNVVPVSLWGNLYKRKLFSPNLEKSGLKFGEDLLLGLQLYCRAEAIMISPKYVYLYRWGGITSKYQPYFLASVKNLFKKKMDFLEKIDFPRAHRTSIIELVNCLASDIEQLTVYFPKQKKDNIEKLKTEMSDPIYNFFSEVKGDPYFVRGNLNEAVCRLDAENAYYIAEKKSKKPINKIRYFIKCCMSFFLRFIKL